jgi:RNA-directed DNA polymerase
VKRMYPPTSLIEQIASNDVLQQAYDWLCARRKAYSANNDVWDLCWRWAEVKPRLQAELLAGTYRLGVLERRAGEESVIELWSSLDALVLKATALVLHRHLKPVLSSRCYHLAGTGGAKGAVRAVANHVGKNTFVYRTDVKSYYASIHPLILNDMLTDHIKDVRVLDLLWNYIYRTVYDGGYYKDICFGICRGCPLSPLIGALYLKQLDDQIVSTGLFYVRFMDDIVIMAPTRWKLRAGIRKVNETLESLKLRRHPDKTFIGRISRGFEFLGYFFSPSGFDIARKTFVRFAERITRLYEHGVEKLRIEEYTRRWFQWVRAGLRVNGKVGLLNYLSKQCIPIQRSHQLNHHVFDTYESLGDPSLPPWSIIVMTAFLIGCQLSILKRRRAAYHNLLLHNLPGPMGQQ